MTSAKSTVKIGFLPTFERPGCREVHRLASGFVGQCHLVLNNESESVQARRPR